MFTIAAGIVLGGIVLFVLYVILMIVLDAINTGY